MLKRSSGRSIVVDTNNKFGPRHIRAFIFLPLVGLSIGELTQMFFPMPKLFQFAAVRHVHGGLEFALKQIQLFGHVNVVNVLGGEADVIFKIDLVVVLLKLSQIKLPLIVEVIDRYGAMCPLVVLVSIKATNVVSPAHAVGLVAGQIKNRLQVTIVQTACC